MSHCCLCAAKLEAGDTICPICQTDQKRAHRFQQQDRRKKRWPKKLSLIVPLVLLVISFFIVSDVLRAPSQVTRSRKEFRKTVRSYQSERAFWNKRKDQLLGNSDSVAAFANKPPEVLVAYLIDSLHFDLDGKETITLVTDQEHCSLFLSKYEARPFPFRVLLSGQFDLVEEEGELKAKPISLRRGKRVLPEDCAWAYFGEEVNALTER